jgi:NADH:ubiquinone oxidoreductase subunit 2 (subunit N)
MLGTPPSIGFFAKLLSFLVLSFRPDLELVIACVLTLALLIFYLQTIRARGSIRRRLMLRAAETKRSMVLFLIVTQINFYLFVVFLPLLFDILAAYLSK